MAIQPLQNINQMVSQTSDKAISKEGTPFSSFFDMAMENLEEVNSLTKEADQMSIDFALGRIDNVADVQIAQEKASLALQYTVTIGNKLIDAYNEIIRMQV